MPPRSYIPSSKIFIVLLFLAAIGFFFIIFGAAYSQAWSMPSALVTPIMALGSFVAGSTFLGGGAVAFPGLTKIMAVDPSSAKTFSLAIQSVGMTSASLYICFSVKNIPWRFFALYLPGVIIGLLVSLGFLEKVVAGNDLRIGFSLFVLIFMLIYLWAYTNKKAHYTDLGKLSIVDKNLIFKAGLLGGIISGLLGSGADLVAFCLLALCLVLSY